MPVPAPRNRLLDDNPRCSAPSQWPLKWLRSWPVRALAASLLLSACGGGDSPTTPISVEPSVALSSAPRWPATDATAAYRATDATGATGATAARVRPLAGDEFSTGYQIDTNQRDAVLLFLRSVHDSSSGVPVDWTGSLSGCNAGSTSTASQDATQRRINWVRAMAGVPAAVQLDAVLNQKAQQAALMMAAQGQLSHAPQPGWACWTAAGAEAAANSNLTQNAGASVITDDYLHDPGANNAAVGHRRWLLHPQTRAMGTGDVQGSDGTRSVAANVLWVIDSQVGAVRPAVRDGFVAWPPPGFVPHTSVYPRWSISYPGADFSQALLSMSENGQAIATQAEPVESGYGENTLVWLPGAWRDGMRWSRPTADTRYQVSVANVRVGAELRNFSYSVTVFDAEAPAAWAGIGSVRGSANVMAATASRYDFNAVSSATGYQWSSRPLAALVWAEGAETGGAGVQIETSAGYEPMPVGIAAEGNRAFHLAHTQPADQTIGLRPTVVPSATTRLRWASRLGWATAAQSALVEASTDDGRSWATLYRQDGNGGEGERGFAQREISLGALAGQAVLLRFRYARPLGSYYPQATAGVGWYVDDLRLINADTFSGAGTQSQTTTPTQLLSLPSAGRWLIQARPGMYGQWPAWSAGLVVQAEAASASARVDCLFEWAQVRYPEALSPRAQTQFSSPYLFRAYASEFYVGWSSADNHIYTLSQGVLADLGASETWMGLAGC